MTSDDRILKSVIMKKSSIKCLIHVSDALRIGTCVSHELKIWCKRLLDTVLNMNDASCIVNVCMASYTTLSQNESLGSRPCVI